MSQVGVTTQQAGAALQTVAQQLAQSYSAAAVQQHTDWRALSRALKD